MTKETLVAAVQKLEAARRVRDLAQGRLYIAQVRFMNSGTEEDCTAQGATSIDLINAFEDERLAQGKIDEIKMELEIQKKA